MATFVICHGAWDGGWYWKETANHLRGFGHEVYTPTYTGLGERNHLATPEINLATHIQDIVNVIQYEDLHNIILVGHSYGGAVITGVTELVSERISELVYVDALIPQDGESVASLFGDSPIVGELVQLANQYGDGWKVPFPFEEPYDPRQVSQPLQTFLQELRVQNPNAAILPRTFISCTERGDDPTYEPVEASAQYARSQGWKYYELATGHNPSETIPKETAILFNDISRHQNDEFY